MMRAWQWFLGLPRRTVLAAAFLALAGQFAGLYAPGSPEPGLISVPGLDKVIHVVLFALPVWLFLRAGVRAWIVIPLALVQVVASELLQARLIPYRAGDVHDAIADVVGIALGVWLDAGAKLTARADGSPRQRRAG